MLQMARAIQSLSERIFALGERVTQLEQAANLKHANGKPQPPARFEPRIY